MSPNTTTNPRNPVLGRAARKRPEAWTTEINGNEGRRGSRNRSKIASITGNGSWLAASTASFKTPSTRLRVKEKEETNRESHQNGENRDGWTKRERERERFEDGSENAGLKTGRIVKTKQTRVNSRIYGDARRAPQTEELEIDLHLSDSDLGRYDNSVKLELEYNKDRVVFTHTRPRACSCDHPRGSFATKWNQEDGTASVVWFSLFYEIARRFLDF